MSYALGAWYDPLVSAVSSAAGSAASSAGQRLASSAAPELKTAVVGAVREVLPDVKIALSSALADGVSVITKKNQAALAGFGIAIGLFTIGSLTLMLAQYRRLRSCCPTRG